ncbi:MAG: ribulose-phosphate 3-epimerase, partial [Bacteroidota bacterium]
GAFVEAGAATLTVHAEATRHLDRTLGAIRELGVKVGVALNPATPLSWVEAILPAVDILLLMTVNPGFGGQSFIHYVLDKVAAARQWREEHRATYLIEVDGGVDSQTALPLLRAGADVLVAGSYVFRSAQPLDTISSLKQLSALDQTA